MMAFRKVAGASGLVFGVLLLVSAFAGGSPPAGDASVANILSYVADHEGGIKLAMVAGSLSGFFAILWLVATFSRLRDGGGEARSWALVGLVGVVMTGVMAALTNGVSAIVVAGGAALDEATVIALWKTTWVDTSFLAAFLAAGLLGFGMAGVRGKVGPVWLGYVAVVGAVLALVGSIAPVEVANGSALGIGAFLGYLLFTLYVLVSSVSLLRSPTESAPA
jgi:hypothetical protein